MNMTIQSSPILAEYNTELDLETTRLIQKAVTITVSSTRRGFNIYARLQPSVNMQLSNMPPEPFGIKVNSTSLSIANNFYTAKNIKLSDLLICSFSGNITRSAKVDFDVLLNPVGYNYEPGFFDYSLIFTVSER